jgi:transposase
MPSYARKPEPRFRGTLWAPIGLPVVISNGLSAGELRAAASGSRDVAFNKAVEALALGAEGLSKAEIERRTGISPRSTAMFEAAYAERGLDGLSNRGCRPLIAEAAELRAVAETSNDPIFVASLTAVSLLLEGLTDREVAEIVGVTRERPKAWLNKYRMEGIGALRDRPSRPRAIVGRPMALEMAARLRAAADERNGRDRDRFLAVAEVMEGVDIGGVAADFGFAEARLKQWYDRCVARGVEGLASDGARRRD